MLLSMTGYGKALAETPSGLLLVEIKSLNNKFLDLQIRLPKKYSDKEYDLRAEITNKLIRGKVSIYLNFESSEMKALSAEINQTNAEKYFHQIKALAEKLNLETNNILPSILDLPDVVIENQQADEEEWNLIKNAIYEALENFINYRKTEGEKTEKEVLECVQKIQKLLKDVETEDPNRSILMKEKLRKALNESLVEDQIDDNRFEQELIYYLEKFDISEEKQRLKHHCEYFLKNLNSSDSNGKKLNFISQEMGREINTIGSKANNLVIQQLVVEMKNELEKVKEQVLNVV